MRAKYTKDSIKLIATICAKHKKLKDAVASLNTENVLRADGKQFTYQDVANLKSRNKRMFTINGAPSKKIKTRKLKAAVTVQHTPKASDEKTALLELVLGSSLTSDLKIKLIGVLVK